MKKYLILLAWIVPYTLFGQNAWDAYRYSHISYQGSARSLALGNAVTALGGDFTSISMNPAAAGLYHYSEFSFTPAFTTRFSQVDYFNQPANDKYTRLGVSEFGYVGSWNLSGKRQGPITLSFAAGYNKVQDFTHQTSVLLNGSTTSWLSSAATLTDGISFEKLEHKDGYNPYYDSGAPWRSVLAWNTYLLDLIPDTHNQYIGRTENIDHDNQEIYVGGLLDQRFLRESKGSMGDYVFALGSNFNDRIFVGASFAFRNIHYRTFEKYVETAQNPQEFQTGFRDFSHTYQQTTTGSGFHMKVGIIALPLNNLRIGAAFTTPTWTTLTDEWQERMTARFVDGYEHEDSPYGRYSYKVQTPWRYSVGATYLLGNTGLISVDYEGVDYRNMNMSALYDKMEFAKENDDIRLGSPDYRFGISHIIRAGAEFRIGTFSLRGGYSYYSAGEELLNDSHRVSGGLGIRGKRSFADVGVSYRLKENEYFSLYDIADTPAPGMNTLTRLRVAFTVGFRF